jgi:hypothetical protein
LIYNVNESYSYHVGDDLLYHVCVYMSDA